MKHLLRVLALLSVLAILPVAYCEDISIGSKGDTVKSVQARLIALGFLSDQADGKFGKKTEDAVKSFQRANDLAVTGIVDAETLSCLLPEPTPSPRPTPKATPAPAEPTAPATPEPVLPTIEADALPVTRLRSNNDYTVGLQLESGTYFLRPLTSASSVTLVESNGVGNYLQPDDLAVLALEEDMVLRVQGDFDVYEAPEYLFDGRMLGCGRYIVGKSLPAGTYNVSGDIELANLCIYRPDGTNASYYIDTPEEKIKKLQLEAGDVVIIGLGNFTFTAKEPQIK